jgi:hypothetical protein
MKRTKALLLLHLISCGIRLFLITPLQSSPLEVYEARKNNNTQQVNRPAHIQTGGLMQADTKVAGKLQPPNKGW